MAYDKKLIYEEVIKAIQYNKLKHFDYIEGFVEPTTPTLYVFFPPESEEFNAIKKELGINKISSKTKMINKWEESENATLQIAAFKLIATDEERQSLSTNYQKTEHSGEVKVNDLSSMTTEELLKRANASKKLSE